MNKMKKGKLSRKVFALLLTLAMVVTMTPALALTAFATEGNVAKIGTTEYATLQDAINAATENQTVTLLKDISLTSTVTISEDKIISLDLGEHQITVPKQSDGFTPDEAQYSKRKAAIINNGEIKSIENGTIESEYSNNAIIVNNGTIDNMKNTLTIHAKESGSAAIANYGTITTLSAKAYVSGGTGSDYQESIALYNGGVSGKKGTVKTIENANLYGDRSSTYGIYNDTYGVIETIKSSQVSSTTEYLSYNVALFNKGDINSIENSKITVEASNGHQYNHAIWNLDDIGSITDSVVVGSCPGNPGCASSITSDDTITSLTGTHFYGSVGGAAKFISGGYFNVEPQFGNLVVNYVAKALETSVKDDKGRSYGYQVIEDKDAYEEQEANIGGVASVKQAGSNEVTNYTSLTDAVNATKPGAVITLNQDITMPCGVITFKKTDVTLDLAGHTLEFTGTTSSGITVQWNTVLTIKDSSKEQTGRITSSSCFNLILAYGDPNGTSNNYDAVLNLESGTLEGYLTTVSLYSHVILNVSGGTIKNTNGSWAYGTIGHSSDIGCVTVNITGGKIETIESDAPLFSDKDTKMNYNLLGGTYTKDPTKWVNTEKSTVTKNDEAGTWTVSTATTEAVAQVGDETYSSFMDAFRAAKALKTATVKMLKNDNLLHIPFFVNNGENITIDLNGYALTGGCDDEFTIQKNAILTFKDSSEGQNGSFTHTGRYDLADNNGTLNLESGTLNVKNYGVSYGYNGTIVNISGGTINSSGRVVQNPAGAQVNISGGNIIGVANPSASTPYTQLNGTGTFKVTGGYYSFDPTTKIDQTQYEVVELTESDEDYDATYKFKVQKKTVAAVAKIGDTEYESLAAAVSAAEDGDKIELLADITLTETVCVNKQITLDLGEFNIKPVSSGLKANEKGTKDALIAVNYGGDLTIMGTTGKISSNGVESVYAAVKLTEKGETNQSIPAKLTVNSGTLEGYYYGITGNGNRRNTEITINGGTVKGTKEDDCAGIYNPQNGTLTVTGGTIEGAVGVYVKAGTVAVFTGGTIKGNGTDTDFVHNDNGFNNTGAALVVENCGYPGGIPKIEISGSTFIAKNGDAVESYAHGEGNQAITGFITGGTFSSNVSNVAADKSVKNLCATTHQAVQTTINDKYWWTVGVNQGPQQTVVVQENTQVSIAEGVSGVTEQAAKEKVTETVNNTAVQNFTNTDIKEATTSNSKNASANLDKVKGALATAATGATEAVTSAITNLQNDNELDSYIKVLTTSAVVANYTVQAASTAKNTTVTEMAFNVKPMVEMKVDNETVRAEIPNEAITEPITFRLPVESSVPTGVIVKVYHNASQKSTADDDFFGNYKVQEENGQKYIELASDHFSYFTYVLTEEVVGTAAYTATLNLADSIGILFYINKPTGTLSKYEVTATYKDATTTTPSESFETTTTTPNKYCIKIADCAAAEMFEKVHVVVSYDGINIKEFDYSVYDYCNSKINKTDSSVKLKELCRTALDYGTYAKKFFNYTEKNPVENTYVARDVSGVTAFGTGASKSGLITGIKSVSATLSLESKTKIIFYLTPDNKNINDFTYSFSGGGLSNVTPEVKKDDKGRIQVDAAGIAASKLGEVYTLTITPAGGGDSMTVNYSPMGYAQTKQTSGTPDLPNLVKSLYQYYLAANTFFD